MRPVPAVPFALLVAAAASGCPDDGPAAGPDARDDSADAGDDAGDSHDEIGPSDGDDGVALLAARPAFGCALGLQDNDRDGVCRPSCALAAPDCGEIRHCDDSSGAAACVCGRGYSGDDCAACAAGFERSGDACVPDHEWAVLVYMAADNALDGYAAADLEEIADAGSSDSLHLVVLHDGLSAPARVYYVESGDPVPVTEPREADTGDFRTLRDFGRWAVDAYPARHTALIVWNHGGGWKGGAPIGTRAVGMDAHGSPDGISISNGDLGRALEGIVGALGEARIDVVGFDACLMGMWEVAAATAPFADYLVASSENEPFDGWSYLEPLRALGAAPETEPADFAGSLVDAYADGSAMHYTLAATDLRALDAVSTAVDDLAAALLVDAEAFPDVETARAASQGFADADSRDLWDFAARTAALEGVSADVAAAANAVVAKLVIARVASWADAGHPGAHGLSIHLPGRGASVDPAYGAPAAPWSWTRWDEFLAAFAGE